MKKLVVVLFAVMFTILAPAGHCEFLSQVITRDQNDDVFQQRLAKRGKPSLWQIDNASLTPAQKIAKAMGLTESGGKPVVGASGEIRSVWQYTKPTWNSLSKAYNKDIFGKNEPLPWTRANGEHVTVWKVEQLMSKGRDVREIALIWNTSLGGSEKPLVLKGVNRHNVPYDSSKHAQKVVSAWRKL